MLALSQPPYLRWALAVLIVVLALVWDLSGRSTERAPFAASDIRRGTTIEPGAVVWKDVPVGLFDVAPPEGHTAAVSIATGDPITGAMTVTGVMVPDGWWTVPVGTPMAVTPGSPVRVVLPDGQATDGVVVEPSTEDAFGIQSAGLVAVPPHYADVAGLAAAANQLVVLYSP